MQFGGISFEQAVISSFNEQFPTATVYGCWFHFKQSLNRHIQSFGLIKAYNDDENIRSTVKQFGAFK